MSAADVAQFQKVFMSSYFAERGGAPAGLAPGKALTPFLERNPGASRVTVPVIQLTTPTFAALAPISFANYPEPGETTTFTATKVTGTPGTTAVYDITTTTSYPTGDLRQSYVEEYYVQDIGLDPAKGWNTGSTPDSKWTIDDPIVNKVGGAWVSDSNAIFTQDAKARVKQILTFTDGTTRTETIASVTDPVTGANKFDPSAFDINGSLDLSQAFIPSAPTAGSNVAYSSIVTYNVNPSTSPNFWFWKGSNSQKILGIRYYTESIDTTNNKYMANTVNFEKTLDSLATTTSGIAGVLAGSTYGALAESVLRQQVVYDLDSTKKFPAAGTGKITSNMQTRVVNVTGNTSFYLTQLDSDAASLGTTLYVPTGNATTLLGTDPTLFSFSRQQQVKTATGTVAFAVTNTDASGQGALATVYTAITEGTYTTTIASAPTSNLMPVSGGSGGGAVATFNGQQTIGTLIPATSAAVTNTMGQTGSVEAWIYITTMTDTAGIVHKGVAVDFSDECFSFQGWNNGGQMAIVLDKAGGGNNYDLVLSNTNLVKNTWYYLVATWDTTLGNSSYIKLYINGAVSNSAKPSVAASGYRSNTSGVLVGSQLPSSYSTAYGYFGFAGKITGVNVSGSATSPLTDAQVLANYNTYKGQTSTW